ncbi:MAG: SMC-Scp complex subunit ScpB [Thermodesulfobacteriota bacterium]
MNPTELKNIVESLLFVSDTPLNAEAIKKIVTDADIRDIRQVLSDLKAEFEARQGGFVLSEVADGWQFRTRNDYKEWIKRMVKPPPVRLGKAALETLAIIAYHQPVIRADVEKIRGVDSGAILRTLLERRLIRILGKKEIPGRPLIYATTRHFLEVFNLKSLQDMPSLKEIQAFTRSEDDSLEPPLVEADVIVAPEDDPGTADEGAAAGQETETPAPADTEPEAAGPPEVTSPAGEPEVPEAGARDEQPAPPEGRDEPSSPPEEPEGEKENSDFEGHL